MNWFGAASLIHEELGYDATLWICGDADEIAVSVQHMADGESNSICFAARTPEEVETKLRNAVMQLKMRVYK